ncbi:CvpA family protein [Brotaphodocola catenula]|uniref:CvpA family protein n=1 Tax=Brotaphodocola catenula TaxID=2885361 RepID=A0AAE3AS40_9FIRM|nr:CvpA family protein [Brotaphodocola catenula]MCC2164977.1 CvpA family protein [Brotaphodocola catenula]
MMKEIMDHWLFWLVVIFLLGMILYGHYRGLIHKILTVSSLIVGMVFARIAVPYVTGLLRKHTNLYSVIGKALLKVAGGPGAELGDLLPAQQRELIGRLHLPSQMKDALLANNNYEIYKLLGVDAFWGYLERSLSNMVLNLIVSVLVFMVAFFLLRGIGICLNLVSRLPILSGVNQLAGAVVGGLEGLFILWTLALLVRACSSAGWVQPILGQIQESVCLTFLYEHNLFNWLMMSILNCLG